MTAVDELREAARLMRERAEKATPGPWDRPLNVRYKNVVTASKPDDEPRDYVGDRPERCCVATVPTWSTGRHTRVRSGRDLEHIASWHPGVALAVADWLLETAEDWRLEVTPQCTEDAALVVARVYLGRQP